MLIDSSGLFVLKIRDEDIWKNLFVIEHHGFEWNIFYCIRWPNGQERWLELEKGCKTVRCKGWGLQHVFVKCWGVHFLGGTDRLKDERGRASPGGSEAKRRGSGGYQKGSRGYPPEGECVAGMFSADGLRTDLTSLQAQELFCTDLMPVYFFNSTPMGVRAKMLY